MGRVAILSTLSLAGLDHMDRASDLARLKKIRRERQRELARIDAAILKITGYSRSSPGGKSKPPPDKKDPVPARRNGSRGRRIRTR